MFYFESRVNFFSLFQTFPVLSGVYLHFHDWKKSALLLVLLGHMINQNRVLFLSALQVTVHRCKANLRDLDKDKVQLSSRIKDLKFRYNRLTIQTYLNCAFYLYCFETSHFSFSFSQTSGAESQARAERVSQIQAELENLSHQNSTLVQQIEQYRNANIRTKEEQGKVRYEWNSRRKTRLFF